MSERPVVIVGAGLAGACAAFWLSERRPVVMLEAEEPAAGASGAAAGLVNPFLGRKARPSWRWREALAALTETLDAADAPGLFRRVGVLRPAGDARQADGFRQSAERHDGAGWCEAPVSAERWPHVLAPHGALWIPDGGHVEIPRLVDALLAAAVARGAKVRMGTRLTSWRSDGTRAVAITDTGAIPAALLLLAMGDGLPRLPPFDRFPFGRVKGQTVALERPPSLSADGPVVSGQTYLVPTDGGVVVGATFEHTFVDLAPSASASAALREGATALVPALAGARILDARAGVRLTVPTTLSALRLPVVGPLPGAPGVWVFAGLGAKGLLTAPLLARLLPTALADPGVLPAEVRRPLDVWPGGGGAPP